MTDIPSLVESVPACNCSGADDGAWGLASHASNCATIVARLRRFHVGHQIASGKGEVICMTCHMELLSTQDDALADARYEVTRLRAENEHLRMEDGLSKFYAQKDEIERLRAELQNCNDLCSIEDGGGTVSQVLARKLEKLRAELETERRKVEVAREAFLRFTRMYPNSPHILNICNDALAALTPSERKAGE